MREMLVAGLLLVGCTDSSGGKGDFLEPDAGATGREPQRVHEVVRTVLLEPASEPELDGRMAAGALCPEGSIVLTGGCIVRDGQEADVILEQSYPGSQGWRCHWKNLAASAYDAKVIVRCLDSM